LDSKIKAYDDVNRELRELKNEYSNLEHTMISQKQDKELKLTHQIDKMAREIELLRN
jgi:predicted nuclease with TOPRIM domain